MNIHPVIVHFPVALLSVYVLLELLRFKKLVSNPDWTYFKGFLLILGTLGSYGALFTGEIAERIANPPENLVSMHEKFAQITVFIFTILTINYLIIAIEDFFGKNLKTSVYVKTCEFIFTAREKIFKKQLVILLALLGIVVLTVTGALGGSMVYGVKSDPVNSFVNKILFSR